MNRLLLTLTARAARKEPVRVLLTVLTAVLSTLVLLSGLAAIPVATAQLRVSEQGLPTKGEVERGLFVAHAVEFFRGQRVEVLRVAPGGGEVLPQGVARVPENGTLVASPQARRLLASDAVFAQRYAASVTGTLDAHALEGPRVLRLVIGTTAADVTARGGGLVGGFGSAGPSDVRIPSVVNVGAPFMVVAFLVPILWLYGVLAGLGAATRDTRLAALRLVGARQAVLGRVVILEALLVGLTGTFLGTVAFVTLSPLLAPVLPLGDGVWPRDVRVPSLAWPGVVLGLPLVMALAARLSARHTLREPLAVARRGRRRATAPWIGLGSLAVGVAAGAASVLWADEDAVDARLALFVVAFLACAVGAVLTGTLVSRLIARLLHRRPRGLAQLLAARSIEHQGGRAASVGVGLAMLVLVSGSLLAFFPLLSDVAAKDQLDVAESLGQSAMVVEVRSPQDLAAIGASPDIKGLGEFHILSTDSTQSATAVCGTLDLDCATEAERLVSDLAKATKVRPDRVINDPDPGLWGGSADAGHFALVQPAAAADLERARNVVLAHSVGGTVRTLQEQAEESARTSLPFRVATLIVLALAAIVALASLAISLVGQVLARHRSTYHLRVAGAPIGMLWRSLVIQAMLIVVPAVVLAWVLGVALSVVFLELNAGDVAAPLGGITLVAVAAGVIAPLAALFTFAALARSARTRPISA